MMKWGLSSLLILAGGVAGPGALAQIGGPPAPGPVDKLAAPAVRGVLDAFPGARVETSGTTGDSIVAFYGTPMAGGATAAEAAAAWLNAHDDALGAANPELTLTRSHQMSNGRFTVFAYGQTMGGVPVEYAQARVLVLNPVWAGDDYRVVYAAGRLLSGPEGGFGAPGISGEDAALIIKNHIAYKWLPNWSAAELVVMFDGATGEAVQAWRVQGWNEPTGPDHIGYSFLLDAEDGGLIEARNEVVEVEVEGVAEGNATPGVLPDVGYNPAAATPLTQLIIEGPSGDVVTDDDGTFVVDAPEPAFVPLATSLLDGLWVSVQDDQGPTLAFNGVENGLSGITLLLNDAPTEFETAQVNAFVHTTLTHNYIKSRAPEFTEIDIPLEANVNINDDCNANFSPFNININFFRSLGGCVNTAYSSVVAHEYGHFIVNRLGLAQGAFGEGYSDTVSIQLYDIGIVGQDFTGPGTFVRDPENAQVQFPCSGGIHFCGQILGGTWRWIRLNFGETYGSEAGLDISRQLHVDWTMITLGGQGSNSAHPTTAIEVLTVDDDNGDLSDGTPNYDDICAAFDRHAVPCPPVAPVLFQFVGEAPGLLTPDQPTPISVEIVGNGDEPIPGTAKLFASTASAGGPFVEQPLVGAGGGLEGELPGVACGGSVWWYLQTDTNQSGLVTAPLGAPADVFENLAANALIAQVDADFDAPAGFSVGAPGDNASSGVWERVDPVGTSAQPGDDNTEDGTDCWVTGQHPGGGAGANDVDAGTTTLRSDVYDLTGGQEAVVSYYRWYSNAAGNAPNSDVFIVQISNDAGGGWTTVETVGPAGPETEGGWFFVEFNPADFVELTDEVQLQFIASDLGDGSLVEAAIDDFKIDRIDCSAPADPCDAADLDGDGGVGSGDLNILLANFGGAGPAGDIDASGGVDSADLNALLSVFGDACDG